MQLEGNLVVGLEDNAFSQGDLQGLETLDLSDNLLSHLGMDRWGWGGIDWLIDWLTDHPTDRLITQLT